MNYKNEITKNLLSFGAIDILGLLIPIITMPILTRALGPSQYGVYMLLLTILNFGHTIIDYGTQFTAVRVLANNRDSPKEIAKIYQETQGLRLFLWFIYSLLSILYTNIMVANDLALYMLFAAFTYLLGYTLTPLWFYQGLGAVDRLMKVSLVIKLLNFSVIVVFVNSPSDFKYILASLCIPMLMGGVYLSYIASKKYNVGPPTFSKLKSSLYDGRDVFIGLLAPNFYNAIPTIALGSMYPPAEFVNFAIASKLSSVVVTIQGVVAKALYPIISRIKESQVNKLLIINGAVSLIPMAVLFIFGDFILFVFLGEDFSGVNQYLVIFTVGVLFIGLSSAISKGFLLPHGYDSIYRNVSLRVSFISAIICVFGIYFWGLIGGTVAITLARVLFFIDYFACYSRLK